MGSIEMTTIAWGAPIDRPTAKLVMLALADCPYPPKGDLSGLASIETISRMTGLDEDSVIAEIDWLVESSWLHILEPIAADEMSVTGNITAALTIVYQFGYGLSLPA